MKNWIISIRLKIFMTLLLGIIFPLGMAGIAQLVFPSQASGDFVSNGDHIVGSKLIGQNFEKPQYFWPRPSAISYNPQPSGGSNLGQASAALKAAVDERIAKLKAAHPDQTGEPPQELYFASASGLDPHISPRAAEYQIQRVANARKMNADEISKVISSVTEKRQMGIMGETIINVLVLNLALDKVQVSKKGNK